MLFNPSNKLVGVKANTNLAIWKQLSKLALSKLAKFWSCWEQSTFIIELNAMMEAIQYRKRKNFEQSKSKNEMLLQQKWKQYAFSIGII